MADHNQQEQTRPKKNRDDHRHHAVDAMVIGLISRSLLQYVSTELGAERKTRHSLFSGMDLTPWPGFQDDARHQLQQMLVSHRVRNKDQGGLHNDTAYAIEAYNPEGHSRVSYRVEVDKITTIAHIEKIKDCFIRNSLLEEMYYVKDDKEDLKQGISNWFSNQNIKRIKLTENLSVIPITDKNGKIYKGYKGDSNAFMDIYHQPGNTKWESEICSRFDVNQPHFQPEWQKNTPDATHLMRLRINTMLCLTENGNLHFYRVQKLSKRDNHPCPA